MKKVLVFLFFLLCSIISYATPQMGDLLIYKGDTIRIYPFLLDNYLSQSPLKETFYEKNKGIRLSSTACWRGHQAVFELKGDSLFLQRMYGIDKQEMDVTSLFNRQENIFLGWYTGTITNPWNRIIYDHNSGWGGIYEYETDFIIEAGILKYIKKYHNTIKSSIYTEGDTLMRFIKSNINYRNIKPISYKIRVIIRIDDVDDNGNIIKVSVPRGYSNEYDQEAIRVIKSIPQWQVIRRRGEKIHIPWTIPVIFEAKD